ncbi:MAG: hypothetical protein KDC92_15525 [Bacteroidetes bacterium]|nr:hypothetical protein [Bacteroidota bacterium]
MNKIILLTSIVLFTALFSCDRPSTVPECCYDCSCGYPCQNTKDFIYYTDTLFQNDTFKSYWYFPEGSWWIYKRVDTTADVYDTARVKRTFRKILCDCEFIGDECLEQLELEISHSSKELKRAGGEFRISTDVYHNRCISSGNDLSARAGATHLQYPIKLGNYGNESVYVVDSVTYDFRYYNFKNYVVYDFVNLRLGSDLFNRQIRVRGVGTVYMYSRDYSEWELYKHHINL